MADGVEHAERHDAAAGRRIGRDQQALGCRASSSSFAVSSVVRRLPAVQTCSAMSLSLTRRAKSGFRHRDRAAVDVERDVGFDASTWSAQMPDEPGIDEPPVCTVVIMPQLARRLHQRRVVERRLECAEAGLGQPQTPL